MTKTVTCQRGTIQVHQEDGDLRLEWRVAGQAKAEVESPLRIVGDDLATLDYMGLTIQRLRAR